MDDVMVAIAIALQVLAASFAVIFFSQVFVLIPSRFRVLSSVDARTPLSAFVLAMFGLAVALFLDHYGSDYGASKPIAYSSIVGGSIAAGSWSVIRGIENPSIVNARVSAMAFVVGIVGFLGLCSRTSLGGLFPTIGRSVDWFSLLEDERVLILLLGGLFLLLVFFGRSLDRYSLQLAGLRRREGLERPNGES